VYEYSHVFLEHEEWPEWFTLDFYRGFGRNDPPRLILSIAKEPLRRLIALLPKSPIIHDLKKSLREYDVKGKFLLDIDKPWGFGGVLEPFARRYEFGAHRHLAEYSIAVPRIEKDAGKCENCDGTRKDTDDWECLHCMGSGRKTVMEWGAIDRIAVTLCVLGVVLDKPDKKLLAGINAKQKQLLSVTTFCGRGHAPIRAVLSRPFGDYLRRLSEQKLPEVEAAIKSAHLHMFPRHRRFSDFNFRAGVHANGQLIIDVPGDACGLYVDGFNSCLREVSGPMTLDCHNVDGHHQQFTLLCGLAALTSMARKSVYPNA